MRQGSAVLQHVRSATETDVAPATLYKFVGQCFSVCADQTLQALLELEAPASAGLFRLQIISDVFDDVQRLPALDDFLHTVQVCIRLEI